MQVGGSWPKRSLTQVKLGRAGGGEANPSPSPSRELVAEILRPKPWVVFFRLHHAGDEAIESRAGNFSNVGGTGRHFTATQSRKQVIVNTPASLTGAIYSLGRCDP